MKTRDRSNSGHHSGGSASANLETDLKKLGQELHRYGEGVQTFVHRQVPALKGLKVLVHVDKEPKSLTITCAQAGQGAIGEMRTAIKRYTETHTFKNGRIHTATVEGHDQGAVILLR